MPVCAGVKCPAIRTIERRVRARHAAAPVYQINEIHDAVAIGIEDSKLKGAHINATTKDARTVVEIDRLFNRGTGICIAGVDRR